MISELGEIWIEAWQQYPDIYLKHLGKKLKFLIQDSQFHDQEPGQESSA